ncbi:MULTISPECIES: UDP-N-acetylmuramate dehydrogenase [unclassified Methylophaga]|jgi:UDP-N-acetylmuramate dehydrogenase|uniref:UDP-N-acetylmuramate dehydrogenase n=2 Tax=Methylophaga TaxID=40222 RepID=UPI000E7E4132|nr:MULTISPECIES: UDP-N-acetylmuramate dehydrogenase [unclassified Methylophaga]HBJ41877.1 UDP-N-acetylenolpyruvoylglucosamine reductase [Hyphomonas sp.]|tara:strand:+ start:1782 stop:2672 length:891 start_codon:yes stop_codon:yes gene_type:complete
MMALPRTLKGELKTNEPLSRYNSWRVGGPAKQLYRPTDRNDLALFLQQLPAEEPVLWVGLGSNLLIRDGGFAGTVIVTAGALQTIDVIDNEITAEVGLYCSKLAKQAAKAGLKGAAFWAGIPGTLGGALAMNAGAHGVETWDSVVEVTTIDKQGELHLYNADQFEVSYRYVNLPENQWFVAAKMRFEQGDKETELELIRDLLKKRNISQPTNQPCAGSVFRNPPGDFSGRLIEVSGLKGLTVGGASVSDKHANFIVNNGDATAKDIETLIFEVQQRVEQEHGVKLIPEVHIIGEPS